MWNVSVNSRNVVVFVQGSSPCNWIPKEIKQMEVQKKTQAAERVCGGIACPDRQATLEQLCAEKCLCKQKPKRSEEAGGPRRWGLRGM
jgi:hypothetical protein